jgi:pimeloyl-ACP methyl ester carboxylesterase
MKTLLSITGILARTKQALAPPRAPVKNLDIPHEKISFNTEDGLTLKGWWIKGDRKKTVVLAHSFGASRTGWEGVDAQGNQHKIDWMPSIKILAERGYNAIVFDHRACGESDGDLTYFGKKEALDIVAAVDWVTSRDSSLKDIAIIGFSSGANATLRAISTLEKRDDLHLSGIAISIYWYERMIKKSTKFFTSIPTILLPLIKRSTAFLVCFYPAKEINPCKTITLIKSKIMLVNSAQDEIADTKDIIDIYDARPSGTELVLLERDSRFEVYHFIERHSDIVFEFLDA